MVHVLFSVLYSVLNNCSSLCLSHLNLDPFCHIFVTVLRKDSAIFSSVSVCLHKIRTRFENIPDLSTCSWLRCFPTPFHVLIDQIIKIKYLSTLNLFENISFRYFLQIYHTICIKVAKIIQFSFRLQDFVSFSSK